MSAQETPPPRVTEAPLPSPPLSSLQVRSSRLKNKKIAVELAHKSRLSALPYPDDEERETLAELCELLLLLVQGFLPLLQRALLLRERPLEFLVCERSLLESALAVLQRSLAALHLR